MEEPIEAELINTFEQTDKWPAHLWKRETRKELSQMISDIKTQYSVSSVSLVVDPRMFDLLSILFTFPALNAIGGTIQF